MLRVLLAVIILGRAITRSRDDFVPTAAPIRQLKGRGNKPWAEAASLFVLGLAVASAVLLILPQRTTPTPQNGALFYVISDRPVSSVSIEQSRGLVFVDIKSAGLAPYSNCDFGCYSGEVKIRLLEHAPTTFVLHHLDSGQSKRARWTAQSQGNSPDQTLDEATVVFDDIPLTSSATNGRDFALSLPRVMVGRQTNALSIQYTGRLPEGWSLTQTDWNQPYPELPNPVFSMPDQPMWTYSSRLIRPLASGANPTVVNEDNQRLFAAGIAAGLAGSLLVAALQLIVNGRRGGATTPVAFRGP